MKDSLWRAVYDAIRPLRPAYQRAFPKYDCRDRGRRLRNRSKPGLWSEISSTHQVSSLNLPVDLAPAKRDADDLNWASNTTLDQGSDFFIANRGDNTIVRMAQDGSVVAIRRVVAKSGELKNALLNGIATSTDGSTVCVTFTTPGWNADQGGVLELPAFPRPR